MGTFGSWVYIRPVCKEKSNYKEGKKIKTFFEINLTFCSIRIKSFAKEKIPWYCCWKKNQHHIEVTIYTFCPCIYFFLMLMRFFSFTKLLYEYNRSLLQISVRFFYFFFKLLNYFLISSVYTPDSQRYFPVEVSEV